MELLDWLAPLVLTWGMFILGLVCIMAAIVLIIGVVIYLLKALIDG